MKSIHIGPAAYRAIAEAAILPFQSTGRQQPDGSWLVLVSDEVAPGESDDDIIVRTPPRVPAATHHLMA
ncbi:MAG: hypothetical protein U1E42_03740 [Rhodospirillales bacterium]